MNKKIRWITETAIMLALLVTLQALTKPMGQLVTGSCVNAVLAIAALVGIAMNAILPGKDYEFGSNAQGDTAVNFGPRND